ncbi:MAG: serine/threonine-protein kinase [Ignavibacteria bacterium]|nr:serine/threonine-protein kinase [Ignavibacteria bacterium]MBT8383525.1 serine/threonine-protein kinase [Ignavibacteria bacterium]MBT8391340.1 serine/threonine-protein kinase [Ignavibacteria bacterium]NNJ52795.1 serine/threonine protein kinase [Ignavibacteriaceae bacterium]NNL20027.1 serine/threonine protein kinase [Ignavibacteriaceae bacterium]
MNPERWSKIQSLFDKALELKPSERETFLKNECGDDKELYNEVFSLLSADEKQHSIFSGSAADYVAVDDGTLEGKTFGSYRAVNQIGAGGMGSVYLAERIDGVFEQKVALKVVKPGMNSHEIISRFEEERQILARLQHPNIARLLDGGISELSLPYFTMEFVEGKPITEYCDDKNLNIEERLELFKKVCKAVLYAHQNLVIHRDIKPSNILVQDDGTVKLLDFGIAKVFEEDNEEKFLTRTGMRVMTPEYASPEQVRGETVSTATDIYSLGLILYQLLTGCPPYEIASASALEMERIICLTEPQKPSTMITKIFTSVSEGKQKVSPDIISRNRKTTFPKLKKRIAGDLDNICLMAIRKEPERRYSSIAQFINDIDNHLNGLPVTARKSTASYITKKFIRRHKVGVVVTSIAVMIIALVTVFYTIQLAEERDRAQLEAEKSKRVSEFLAGIFQVSDPEQSKGESITARELLDIGVRRIESELSDQPEVLANMLGVTGGVYTSLGLYDNAKVLMQRSYSINDSLLGSNSPEAVKSLNDLAGLSFAMGNYEAAIEKFNNALEKRKNIFGEESLEAAESMNDLAMVFREEGMYSESEKLLENSLSIRKKLLSPKSRELAQSLNNLAQLKVDIGEYDEAKKLFEESLRIKEENYTKIHPSVTETLGNLAFLLQQMGEYGKASELFNETLEIDKKLFGNLHPVVSTDLYNLASNTALMGDLKAAEKLYTEVLEFDKKLLGKEHPYIALDLNNLAGIYSDKGDYEKAEELYIESLNLNKKIYGNEHPEVATSLSNLGVMYNRWRKYQLAEPLLKSALDMRIKLLGENHPSAVTSMNIYASLLTSKKKYKEAVEQYRKSLSMRIKMLGEDHPQTANAFLGLGNALIGIKNFEEAEEKIIIGLEIYQNKLPADHWNISYAESILGKCYSREGRYEEAENILLKAYDNLLDKRGKDDRLTISSVKMLIKNYELMGKKNIAQKYRQKLRKNDADQLDATTLP